MVSMYPVISKKLFFSWTDFRSGPKWISSEKKEGNSDTGSSIMPSCARHAVNIVARTRGMKVYVGNNLDNVVMIGIYNKGLNLVILPYACEDTNLLPLFEDIFFMHRQAMPSLYDLS